MNRACAVILFLVFTQYLIETTQAKPEPQPADLADYDDGGNGAPCLEDDQCCDNCFCVKDLERCQDRAVIDLLSKQRHGQTTTAV